ncbi:hypothetical protein F511_29009 [Dorcoceras hygrometricum]|uniref:Dystroglycan-like n=1 Tax=Dorcoceras hygrometricum TaxID=472368 RepID=A0A2Z7A3F7_9LAMI|nr:hypothetical protein F511_29009 [Dorcoceras hygrometricum]
MASSLINNSHHIDFKSVFGLDDAGMVQMFETLITTGLKEFLGCPAVFYEAALTEFFANISVREDGMVVSTIGGTAIEISQEMFAAAFEFPTKGLIDLTDVPKNFFFTRSLFSDSKEQVSMSCLKKALKFQYRLLHDILAKTIYVKAGSFDAVTLHRFVSVNENVGIKEVADAPREKKTPVKKTVSKKRPAAVATIPSSGQLVAEIATGDQEPVMEVAPGDADAAIEKVLAQLDLVFKHQDADRSEKVETWFDKAFDEAFDEEFEIANKERKNSEEEIDVDVAAGISTRSLSSKQVAEETMSIDDLLLQISDDLMLPSITAVELTKIRLDESLNFGDVQERDLYSTSLPRISSHDKGKGILVEDEPVRGYPAREMVELICRDVDFLVQLRDQVMSTTQLSTKFKTERNHLPKAAKEQTNYGLTITKTHEHCNNLALLKSGDSSLQTGLLVQSDEGVSDLVVDRIDVTTAINREAPDRTNQRIFKIRRPAAAVYGGAHPRANMRASHGRSGRPASQFSRTRYAIWWPALRGHRATVMRKSLRMVAGSLAPPQAWKSTVVRKLLRRWLRAMLRGGRVIGARPCAVSGEMMRDVTREVAAVRGFLRRDFSWRRPPAGLRSGDVPVMS